MFKKYINSNNSIGDTLFGIIVYTFALFIVLTLFLIFFYITKGALPSIKTFGFGFLTSTKWDPVQNQFGALSSIYGTLMSTFIAILLATPLGIIIALFLVEYAPNFIATPIGYAIELLAAIPSIIYGMWGLFILAPFVNSNIIIPIQSILPFSIFQGKAIGGQSVFTAGIIISIMILPYITTIMRDVFKMVPPPLKESAYGIGATSWEVASKVIIPYGIKGLIGAIFLSLGRALGETMAVTFVIGNSHKFSTSVFTEGNTISSTLANEFGEADTALFTGVLMELGLILFVLSLIIQMASWYMLNRVSKKQKGLL